MVECFHKDSKFRVSRGDECFPVKVGLRQGCVMPPWVFNVFLNEVMKVKVKVRRQVWNITMNKTGR